MDAGVEIYEYTPGFIHSKIFLCDNTSATVSTVNMDYRSFYFHFECGVWFTSEETIKEMQTHFEEILKDSERIDKNVWKKRGVFARLKQWFWHLFAPLM
jgi:cardiolipin synthase